MVMKRVKHFLKNIGRAYINSCNKFYSPMINAGVPIYF